MPYVTLKEWLASWVDVVGLVFNGTSAENAEMLGFVIGVCVQRVNPFLLKKAIRWLVARIRTWILS